MEENKHTVLTRGQIRNKETIIINDRENVSVFRRFRPVFSESMTNEILEKR